jgi:hypothetical protein
LSAFLFVGSSECSVLVMPMKGMMAYGSKALLGRWGSPIPAIVGGFCDG